MEYGAQRLASPLKLRSIPVVQVALKHKEELFFDDMRIDSTQLAYEVFDKYLGMPDREHFVMLCLDSNNNPIHIETVAIGNLSGAIVTPREVLKSAILANAASVYVCHNHPSSNNQASPDDISVTARLRDAFQLMGIRFIDHIILTRRSYTSMRALGHV